MKPLSYTLVAASLALLASIAPRAAFAGSLVSGVYSSAPGKIVYQYSTPLVSVYAETQVGSSQPVVVSQNSKYNVAAVTDVGTSPTVRIVQKGALNVSSVNETGITILGND